MKENGDLNFYAKNKTVFNTYIEMFERFDEKRINKSSIFKNAAKFIFLLHFFYFEINKQIPR
jgi:hypothetical protein